MNCISGATAIPKKKIRSRKKNIRLFLKKIPKLRNETRFLPVTGLEGKVNRLNRASRRNKPAETLNMMSVPFRARYPTSSEMDA